MFLTLALALGGAIVGAAIGKAVGASVGWFIGMTVGQLLSLSRDNPETGSVGPRRTEFRGLDSSFGIPVFKAYGTVRLNGNVIWAGPVIEDLVIERNCVSQQVGGFFGFFEKEQTTCSNVATYHYKQSFAVAFSHGEAADFIRIWASGVLLWNNSASNVTQDAQDSAATGRPESTAGPATLMQEVVLSEFITVTTTPTLRFYYGTPTQAVDAEIAEDVGAANCPAFRHTVYVVISNLDLERWGYRIPEITAEITYTGGAAYPTHIVRDTVGGGGRTFDRWATEVIPGGNDIIAVELQDPAPVWTFIDAYSGDMYRNFEWLPIINETFGTSANITEQGPLMGKVDGNGMWYWTGLIDGFDDPAIIQYDPIRGAVQQADVSTLTTFTRWISHMLHDKTRGLTFAVSSLLGEFLVFVNDRVTFAILNNMSVPEIDDTIELFQIYYPALDINANGAMVMDKEGIVWIGCNSSTNPLYRYDPDTNTLASQGIIYDTTQSPQVQIFDITGISYSWLDDTLVMRADFGGANDGVLKYDHNAGVVTLSNPGAAGGWATDAADNYSKGPHDGGQYIYYTDTGHNVQLNAITLEETRYPYGNWEQDRTPLSGPWVPQVRAWINTGVLQFDYLRANGAGIGLDVIVSDLILTDNEENDSRYGVTAADIDVTDLASKTVKGYTITEQQSIRSALVPLQQGFFFDYVESDAKLLFRIRGRSSIVTIPEDDLAAHEYGQDKGNRLQITYREEFDLPRELSVNYICQPLDYIQCTARFRRLRTDASSNMGFTLPVVMDQDEAQEVAEVLHTDAWTERAVFNFALGPKFLYLDPTDNITISLDDGSAHFMRLTKTVIGRNGIILCEGVADETSLYTAPNAEGVIGDYTPAPFAYNPFTITPVLPALPPLTVTNDDFSLYVGLTTYDTGGIFEPVDVYVTSSGSALRFVGSIDSPAASGSIDTEVEHPDTPAGFYGAIDNGQTITLITPPNEGPSTVTEEQLYQGQNVAVMGDEVLGFQTVSANSPDNGVYTLSGIIRGLRGTDHNVDRHVFPESFLLVENLLRVPMDEQQLNQTITIVLRPKGATESVLQVIEYQGASAAPLAPTDPQVTTSGSPEDYVVSWTRRDRVWGAWSDMGDIPNSEATEDYQLDIMDRDGNVLRTLSATDTTTLTYTNAQMVSDFGSVPETFYGILFQISATVGRGWPRRFVARPDSDYYARNFSADLASPPSTPANVSQKWVTTGYSYNVESEATSDYGASLHLDSSTDGRHMLSFDDLGETRDVELLVRFQVTTWGAASAGAGPRLHVRTRGTAASEQGVYLGFNADGSSVGVWRYDTGTATQIGSVSISTLAHLAGFSTSLQNAVWYRVRFRVSGWRYQVKVWRDDTNEPGLWDLETYYSMTHEYGWTGVGCFESYIDTKFDWIYGAVNGRRAG